MAKREVPADSSVLDDLLLLRERVADRIRELEPYAEELTALREQAEQMGIDVSAKKTARANASAKQKAPAKSAKRNQAKPRRRRRTTAGESRADQVLKVVNEQPGSTISAVAETLGVDATGLYRVVRTLEQDGRLHKDGRQLQPVATATDAPAEQDATS